MGSSTTDSDSNVWTDMVDMVGHLSRHLFRSKARVRHAKRACTKCEGFCTGKFKAFLVKKKQKCDKFPKLHLHFSISRQKSSQTFGWSVNCFSTLRTLRRLPTSARLWMYFQYTACGSRSLVTVRHLWALRKCNQKTWKMCKNVWCFMFPKTWISWNHYIHTLTQGTWICWRQWRAFIRQRPFASFKKREPFKVVVPITSKSKRIAGWIVVDFVCSILIVLDVSTKS